jgi:hypothetical protein
MNTRDIAETLAALFEELIDGPKGEEAYMLNRGDVGLLRSLDKLSAREASVGQDGGASIAAHVDHVRYGLSLFNRWSNGENPFASADWSSSWRKTTVSDTQWQRLRDELRGEARRWGTTLKTPRDVSRVELNGIVATIAHLAYHLGAIRQIDRMSRGPSEQEVVR